MGKLLLESRACPRCGGSGKYSYCQMHGSTCFKCGGRGEVLTKRGLAAQIYLNNLKLKPATEVKVGDKIFYEGFTAGSYSQPSIWFVVESITPDVANGGGRFNLNGTIISKGAGPATSISYGCLPNSKVRVARTKEQVWADQQAALAYQATLTANGTPSKRKLKEAA